MDNILTREVTLRAGGNAAPGKVTYETHLWRSATRDSLNYLLGFDASVLVVSSIVFSITAGCTWRGFAQPSIMHGLISALAGAAALLVYCAVVLAVHVCYRTPKKLCLAKQRQLEEERILLRAEIDRITAELAAAHEEQMQIHHFPHEIPEMMFDTTETYSHIAVVLQERGEALAS